MGPDRLFLGLAILAVFGALLVFWSRFADEREPSAVWQLEPASARSSSPSPSPSTSRRASSWGRTSTPIALLLALLCAAAGWIARRAARPLHRRRRRGGQRRRGRRLAAPARVDRRRWPGRRVAVAVGLAAIFHLFVELDRGAGRQRRPRAGGPAGRGRPVPAAAVRGGRGAGAGLALGRGLGRPGRAAVPARGVPGAGERCRSAAAWCSASASRCCTSRRGRSCPRRRCSSGCSWLPRSRFTALALGRSRTPAVRRLPTGPRRPCRSCC